ncbi:MAG TPA: TAT-variant-translocated molybdopterin oxidoreductase [Candidatus Polarisedimenticolaceae bacterium]|nr:TAT-variant-translocated molybdopterin oxidoreductase [Candidatus Polarisedimenticolaceae bacterium]
MSKTYWRSLGELAGSEESRLFREREFQEGASELPEGVTRREMLTLIGATLSIAGLASCRRPVEHIVPYVQAPEEVIPGVPRRYATTMPFGRAAYGLVVESHEGRPTKIEGNELHPATKGKSSVRTQAAILGLYDPDRSASVLKGGQTSTWADFVKEWAELEKTHLADGGASLALLTQSFASPTLARLLAAFKTRFPHARVATYESVSDENVLEATGGLTPVLHLGQAEVIVALDADLIGTDADNVRNIAGFAEGRARGTSGGAMNRLWAVEPVMSLTGAMADHRWAVPSSRIGDVVRALASGGSVEGIDDKALAAVRKDLESHKTRSLVVAGPRQPADVHAAVLALNVKLGNVGTTVTYHPPVDVALPDRKSLVDLVTALNAGQVQTLVVLGGNPVYDAPSDLDFKSAMAKAKTSVAVTSLLDETAKSATWHLPRAHFLESWGDARAAAGTLSIIQPMILPLYGGKSDVEVLGLLATGADKPGYDLVRETWASLLPAVRLEKAWRRVLHDGLIPGSETVGVIPEARAVGGASPSTQGIEVVFRASPYLHDGRFSNDGWLQELPDQVTKLTWDNPAQISPATAASLGIANEDLIKVSLGGKDVTLPAWIVPGQAEGTVVLTLGYGRQGLGRIANGVGANVGVLRTSSAPDFAGGGSIAKAGGSAIQAPTQEHGSMEERPLVREGSLAEYEHDPEFAKKMSEVPELLSLWNEKAYDHGHQWGMTIDLNTCVGCNACVTACQSENNIPIVGKDQVRRGREMHWIRVDRYFSGPAARPELVFQPVPCMQCENAPCEQVCPVAATVHDDEGLNVMAYNRCIGTRYCSNNCPYKVRRFNFFNFTKDTPESLKLVQNPDVTVRARGVMEKCTYCTQRINAAKLDAKLAGHELKDGDVTTACEQACPAGAITFGDLRDAESRVVKAKQDPRGYAILAELNTKPRTTYLAKVRNPHPDLAAS